MPSTSYPAYSQHQNMYTTQQFPGKFAFIQLIEVFISIFLAYQVSNIYPPPSTQPPNQSQSQYPTTHSQLSAQSPQTSQQSLVK